MDGSLDVDASSVSLLFVVSFLLLPLRLVLLLPFDDMRFADIVSNWTSSLSSSLSEYSGSSFIDFTIERGSRRMMSFAILYFSEHIIFIAPTPIQQH